MKDKSEVNVNGKPAFYAMFYTRFREVALELGYALAIHGSLQNDMDLIAVAWTEDAVSSKELRDAINKCLDRTSWSDHNYTISGTNKPHGRISYTITIHSDYYIDLSVIPPNKESPCIAK